MMFLCVKSVCLCIAGTMIIIESSITPESNEGSPVNSVFVQLQIHLFITQMIILSKVWLVSRICWWQVIILMMQMGGYYVGILIVSEVSLYEFNSVFMQVFNNKLYLVSVVCVWVYLTVGLGEIVAGVRPEKKKQDNKYQQIKRVNKETNLEVI
jgi:hypothetical protein